MPARVLPYLVALTPQRFETRITYEKLEGLQFSDDADLIALTGMINHMPRAIDIAREFKKIGKKVIIGGIGAYTLQDEIEKLDIFDSIVVGEVDTAWNIILDDFERGDLKRIYQCQPLKELKGLPFARFDLLKPKLYYKALTDPKNYIVPIETSRGCPHGCIFCSVTRYFGKRVRYRPISEVIDEINYQRGNYFFFTDDNIAINYDRAKELFLALKPLGIHWMGQFDTTVMKNPEILELAGESGCRMAVIGVESLDEDNIVSIQKTHNLHMHVKELIQCFQKNNIRPMCSVMFGMDHDSPESIMQTVNFMIDNKVGMILPNILTPYPRTPLHEKFKDENLILHDNYSLYDSLHCVFQPKQIKPEELEEAYWHTYRHFYNFKTILSRASTAKNSKHFKTLLLQLYLRNCVHGGRHPFSL